MINALPSDKSNSDGSSTPMPPVMPPTSATPNSSPIASTPVGGASAPHGNVSNLSSGLSAKIQGTDSVGSMPPTPPSNAPDKAMDTTPKKAPFKFNGKGLLAALVLTLVVAGGGVGYYMTQQSTDNRQKAASEQVTGAETSRTATDWGVFNQTWHTFMADPSHDWVSYVQESQTNGARYKCDEPIMKVGEETLYGCDLNALFVVYEPEAYIQPAAIGPQDPKLNSVLDALVTNSGLLQEAQKRGLITLDDTIYNSPTKDPVKRMDALRELRETIGNTFNKTVDYEAVAIYFHNQVDPQIPLDQAQAAAKAKMDNLYARLKSGEITMQQAGDEIAADNIKGDTTGVSLAKLDQQYKENAYNLREGHNFDSEFFTDSSLDEELRSLGEGQMSTVRLCKDHSFTEQEMYDAMQKQQTPNFPLVDSCYIIFKVNKINFGWTDQSSNVVNGEDYLKTTYSKQTDKMTQNFKQ